MDYRLFTSEMQHEHVRRQMLQAEADHFAHTLNAEMALASGDLDGAQAETELAAAAAARVDVLAAKPK